jgi:hypothetical protein
MIVMRKNAESEIEAKLILWCFARLEELCMGCLGAKECGDCHCQNEFCFHFLCV